MKINRSGPKTNVGQSTSTTGPSKAGKAFVDALGNTQSTEGAASLAGIAADFAKADQGNQQQVDGFVERAVHEIMVREFGKLTADDRELVASWLKTDPVMREAVIKHFRTLAS